MATFVLYHASCADGFGAAYAAWRSLGDAATYQPVQYGQPLPDLPDGATVFILDFSYSRDVLSALARRTNLLVLDHHKTAEAELAGLACARFDLNRSGAVLAWEHFHPGEPVPLLLRYVQDRDLWRWELPESRAFSAALALEPRDFIRWDELAFGPSDGDGFLARGKAVLTYQSQLVASLCDKAFPADVGGHRVPAVNSPSLQSEIGEELCHRHPDAPFAAVFFLKDESTEVWSLRSRNGFDVSAVARPLGGGGHPAAAGFTVQRERSPL
jgi:hypothetical protein